MDKLGIKRENIIDITDEDSNVFLDVKKEEVENECIFIEDDDVEILEVIPGKAEKNVCTRGDFETIFLPEMYAGVAVETPFFDINSYRKIYCHSKDNENEINKPDFNINSNPIGNDVYQSVMDSNIGLREGLQIRNENVYNNCTPSPIIYKNSCGDNQPIYKGRYTYKDKYRHHTTIKDNKHEHKTPMNCACQYENSCAQTSAENGSEFSVKPVNSLVANMFQQDKQLQSQKECDNHNRNMFQSNKKLIHAAKTFYKSTQNNWADNFTMSTMSSLVTSGKDSGKLNEESKYKCPICKVEKTFDTLLAVNNHLKFAHISFLSSGRANLK